MSRWSASTSHGKGRAQRVGVNFDAGALAQAPDRPQTIRSRFPVISWGRGESEGAPVTKGEPKWES